MTTHASKKILIVEDEADIAQLVKLYLEKDGFRTSIASTGIEALTLIKANRPDMVILDIMLPEMDGLEICKKIRTATDTALLPVHLGKHEIQNDHIGAMGLDQREGFDTCRGDRRSKPIFFKIQFHQVSNICFVFDDQYLLGRMGCHMVTD